jgi:tetratricopeptide (TPR) repeat protein
MLLPFQWRTAEQFFLSGQTLFQEGHYEQALTALRRAEKEFRNLDARGTPFRTVLSNGVSGLANTLALSGRCYQALRNFEQAIIRYETSFINAKYEKAKPFQTFTLSLQKDLISCYEAELKALDEKALQGILNQDTELDITFRFPFSISKKAIPLARLYELDPERYPQFKKLYLRSCHADSDSRRKAGTELDESRMKMAVMAIWMLLSMLWATYSMIVVKALLPK